jgi:hypothetical protein
MLLVAPALSFHPATGSILRYFPGELDVECIGVAMDWRRSLRVVFRTEGRNGPAAQMFTEDQV